MYLSHAVRTIRDEPMAEESVDLVVTLTDDAKRAAFADEVEAIGGAVVAELQFSAVHVRLPETAVEALCDLDGIDRIETAETLRLVGDDATESTDAPDPAGTDEQTTDTTSTTRLSGRDREQ